MGWRAWTRERLTATLLQDYLQDQVVQNYSSRAQRTAEGPAALDAGMTSWLQDERVLETVQSGAWKHVAGNRPGAHISGTATQATVSNTSLIVLLENTVRVRGFTYDAATGRLTCTTPGTYFVSAGIAYSGNANGRRYVQLYLNGTVIPSGTVTELVAGTSNTLQLHTGMVPVTMVAGDYITMGGLQDSGSAINILRASSFLVAFLAWD